jgi:hypothetical protein
VIRLGGKEEILPFTHIFQHCMNKLECNLFHSCGYNSTVYINYFSWLIDQIKMDDKTFTNGLSIKSILFQKVYCVFLLMLLKSCLLTTIMLYLIFLIHSKWLGNVKCKEEMCRTARIKIPISY